MDRYALRLCGQQKHCFRGLSCQGPHPACQHPQCLPLCCTFFIRQSNRLDLFCCPRHCYSAKDRNNARPTQYVHQGACVGNSLRAPLRAQSASKSAACGNPSDHTATDRNPKITGLTSALRCMDCGSRSITLQSVTSRSRCVRPSAKFPLANKVVPTSRCPFIIGPKASCLLARTRIRRPAWMPHLPKSYNVCGPEGVQQRKQLLRVVRRLA